MNKLLNSKKFWVSVVASVIPLLNSAFGWGMVANEIAVAMAPMLTYVVGQGLSDFGKEKARVVADSSFKMGQNTYPGAISGRVISDDPTPHQVTTGVKTLLIDA